MEQKKIPQLLEEISEEMCDKYCKYPEMHLTEDELMAICENCPMTTKL